MVAKALVKMHPKKAKISVDRVITRLPMKELIMNPLVVSNYVEKEGNIKSEG